MGKTAEESTVNTKHTSMTAQRHADNSAASKPEGHTTSAEQSSSSAASSASLSPSADADAARASLLRSHHQRVARQQRIEPANVPLPFLADDLRPVQPIPSSSPLSSSSTSSSSSSSSRRNPLSHADLEKRSRHASLARTSCPYRWWLAFRVCLRWRVMKHLVAMMILPVLMLMTLWVWMHLPNDVPFAEALLQGDRHTVKWYLDVQQVALNEPLEDDPSPFDRYPLHLATLSNHTELVRDLVDRGALLDVVDVHGFTALHYAANMDNFELIDYLITSGAPIEALDEHQRTPLHIAAIAGSVPVMAALVFNGKADVYKVDIDQRGPMEYSRMLHADNMQRLLEAGEYTDPSSGRKIMPPPTKPNKKKGKGGKRKKKRGTKKRKQEELPTLEAFDPHSPLPSAPSSPSPSPPSSSFSFDDEDAELMALFTGEDEDPAVTAARYKRSAEQARARSEQQQQAAEAYEQLSVNGEFLDAEEFDF